MKYEYGALCGMTSTVGKELGEEAVQYPCVCVQTDVPNGGT
jgi:hypothetical protein